VAVIILQLEAETLHTGLNYAKEKIMNYYKDLSNQLHVLDSKEFEYLLPNGCTEITQAEYEALSKPVQPTIEELRSTMVLTPAQARIKLAGLGLLDGIETTIAALPITDVVSIYWYYATEFRRLDSTLIGFCTSTLGMSDTQLDEIFTSSL